VPAPEGNNNAGKGKAWSGALRAALAQYKAKGVPEGQALRKLAEKVVAQALEGNKDAWKEIGDRLDGKPAQAITGEDGGPVTVEIVRFGADKASA
jgi:hypothetical protein